MEHIKFKGLPDEIAQNAYNKGYFMEAIQHLHGFIENQACSFLMLFGCVKYDSKQEDIWDLSDELSFVNVIKVLRILNQINQKEYLQFKKFNSLRNKIIHQYYKEPYEKVYLGLPKREYDEVFQETIKQIYFFNKCFNCN